MSIVDSVSPGPNPPKRRRNSGLSSRGKKAKAAKTPAPPSIVQAGRDGEWLSPDLLKSSIVELLERDSDPVIDLSNLNHLDGASLQILFAAQTDVKARGKVLGLLNASESLLTWFTYSGATFRFIDALPGAQ